MIFWVGHAVISFYETLAQSNCERESDMTWEIRWIKMVVKRPPFYCALSVWSHPLLFLLFRITSGGNLSLPRAWSLPKAVDPTLPRCSRIQCISMGDIKISEVPHLSSGLFILVSKSCLQWYYFYQKSLQTIKAWYLMDLDGPLGWLNVIFVFAWCVLASETWHLVSQGGAVDGAPPRHRHSAILHDNAVWIFGGMTDLQERSDFWRFDFGESFLGQVNSKLRLTPLGAMCGKSKIAPISSQIQPLFEWP